MRNKAYPFYQWETADSIWELAALAAKKYGDRDAFVCRHDRKSFREFYREAHSLAAYFLSEGCKRRNIAILGENSYEWILAWFGIVLSGNVAVPLDRLLPPEEIAFILGDTKAAAIVYSNDYADMLPAGLETIRMGELYTCMKPGETVPDMTDKDEAFATLHYVLVQLAILLAPFTPFLAEELYQKLTGGESVHLLTWPTNVSVDQKVLDDMAQTRKLIENGLALRMQKDDKQDSIKIRQPLQFASYTGEKLDDLYEQIIREELNIKEVRHIENIEAHLAEYEKVEGGIKPESWLEISKEITPGLRREGLAREVIRAVQAARKLAKLNIDDRIILELKTTDENLQKAIDEWRETIAAETLAVDMFDIKGGYETTTKIDDVELEIALIKAEQ